MKTDMKNSLLIFTVLVVLLGCEKAEIENKSNIRKDAELLGELKNSSVDTLKIGSNHLILDAFLWRDFMPESPAGGSPLLSVNRLIDIDFTGIPGNIDLVKQYVVYNDSIWISDYENETLPSTDYKKEKISRNGPKWGPKVFVNVISKIHDSDLNKDYYLKAENIYIVRTD